MLPTVYEEVEEDVWFPAAATDSSNAQFSYFFPSSFATSVSYTELDISKIWQQPILVIPSRYGNFVPPSLKELLEMADVLTSTEVEAMKLTPESAVTELNVSGRDHNYSDTGDDLQRSSLKEGDADAQTSENLDKHPRGDSPKTRKDSESGRSGDERERRNGRRTGRGQQRRQQEKSKLEFPPGASESS